MRVLLNKHLYVMSRKEFCGVLKIVEKAVKHGIYAVEKGGVAEMKREIIIDRQELKKSVSEYAREGFKVYYNV